MVLIGFHPVSFTQMLDRLSKIARVDAGNTQGVVVFRRLGTRLRAARSSPAKKQMHMGAIGNVASSIINKLFKDLGSFVVILLLKGSYRHFEILDRGLILNVNLHLFGDGRPQSLMSCVGSTAGKRPSRLAVPGSDV